MFRSLGRSITYTATISRTGLSAAKRTLLSRMISFSRTLPSRFDDSLPIMMQKLSAQSANALPYAEQDVLHLADAVAAWHFRSPLGICLRRSLIRYYFLYEISIPVQIVFGARLKGEAEGGGIGGHAWLMLNGEAYFENPTDYKGFAKMYIYPNDKE